MESDRPQLWTRRQLLRTAGITGAAASTSGLRPASGGTRQANRGPCSTRRQPRPRRQQSPRPRRHRSAANAGFQAEWDKLVDAAKQEKTLTIATYAGNGYKKVMEAFQEAFPGMQVEHTQFQSSSRDFVPRLFAEQKAGLYTWDISIMPTQEQIRQVVKAGGNDPIRAAHHPPGRTQRRLLDGRL